MQLKYYSFFILLACTGNAFSSELEFSPARLLSSAADPASVGNSLPKIVRASNGNLSVAWVRTAYLYTNGVLSNRTSQIVSRFSADGGTSWGSEKILGDIRHRNQSVDIATSGSSEFVLAWSSGDVLSEGRLHLAKTSNLGASFESETQVAPFQDNGIEITHPQIAISGSSTILAKASRNLSGPVTGSLLSRLSWGANFTMRTMTPFVHDLESDSQNNLVAIHSYPYSRVTYSTSYNGGLDWDFKGVFYNMYGGADFTISTNNRGTWIASAASGVGGHTLFLLRCEAINPGLFSAPQALDCPVSSHSFSYNPTISGDQRGNWLAIVSANDYQNEGSLYYTVSMNDGLNWSPLAALPGSNSIHTKNVLPSLTTIGEGKWGLVWSTYANNTASKIAYMEIGFPRTSARDWQLFE